MYDELQLIKDKTSNDKTIFSDELLNEKHK